MHMNVIFNISSVTNNATFAKFDMFADFCSFPNDGSIY